MKNNSLREIYYSEFLENCKNFDKDLSKDLDTKHSKIILDSHNKVKTDKDKFIQNFKDWELQSDFSSPIQFSLDHFKILEKKQLFKNFFKLILFLEDSDFKRSFFDDFHILETVGAINLLKNNPVHKTPGCKNFYKIKGCSTNYRWNRYAYIANQIIKKKLIDHDDIYIDIGSYYGGLQSFLYNDLKDVKYFLVDFNHQLLRSYIFLKTLFPDANHLLPDKIDYNENFKKSKNGFYYVSIDDFFKMKNIKPNLISNFFSLGEMTDNYFNDYLSSEIFLRSKYHYFINRFVSAPFFEKTYENSKNIFDYVSKNDFKRIYTDIFPIHNYQILNRKIFNKKAKRPISSSYFEIILNNENWR